MSELDERLNRMAQHLEEGVSKMEKLEVPSKPPEIETENIFDPELLNRIQEEDDSFDDDPMNPIVKMLREYLESIKPPMAFTTPPKSEHKVRIFQLNESIGLVAIDSIERTIEDLLNAGYCCHMPTVVNDYVIMDFSKRKESEEDGK